MEKIRFRANSRFPEVCARNIRARVTPTIMGTATLHMKEKIEHVKAIRVWCIYPNPNPLMEFVTYIMDPLPGKLKVIKPFFVSDRQSVGLEFLSKDFSKVECDPAIFKMHITPIHIEENDVTATKVRYIASKSGKYNWKEIYMNSDGDVGFS